VFITTMAQLVPQDTDAYDDIYDARVGGGFAAPPPTPPAGTGGCGTSDTCRPSVAPTVFFPIPGSSTLIAPALPKPLFTVHSVSGSQRRQFAKTGALTLKVSANSSGRIAATAFSTVSGLKAQVAFGSVSFASITGGNGKLTLRLAKGARKILATKHKLGLTITVTYSRNSTVDVARLTLTSKKTVSKKRTKQAPLQRSAAGRAHRGRVQGA
jgi:hypothetical protein